jgi:hypothetical protein
MRWRKLGLLYRPGGRHPKLLTHAANPLPIALGGDVYRVFYSGRDSEDRSSVGCVDVDLARRRVIVAHGRPAFEHGAPGSYYSHGVSIGNCYEARGTRYMLFMGWQRPQDGHWRGDIGRLVVGADLSLACDGAQPLIGADASDPVSLSYPWVEREGAGYRMWYGSTRTWDAGNGEMLHVINSATSADGDRWSRHGLAVPYVMGRAQAFARPSVLARPDGGYDMWFSYRGAGGGRYRIGYASCTATGPWTLRIDEAGIDVSPGEWDGEMIEYPFVFDHAGERYMLYNGDGFGRTGFGVAVQE